MTGILVCLVAGAFASAAPVLENADFFQRNERNEPTHWNIRYTDAEMKKRNLLSAADEVLKLGGAALRGEILLIQPNIRLENGRKYRVSFRARSLGGAADLRVYLQYQRVPGGKSAPVTVTVNGEWRKIGTAWEAGAFEFDYPADGRGPWFVINVSGRNAVEFKDLVVDTQP